METAEVNYKLFNYLIWLYVLCEVVNISSAHQHLFQPITNANKWRYICWQNSGSVCLQYSQMSWRDVHIGQEEQTRLQLIGNAQINHVSDIKKSKNAIEF